LAADLLGCCHFKTWQTDPLYWFIYIWLYVRYFGHEHKIWGNE